MADVQIGKTMYAPEQVFAKAAYARNWFLAIAGLSFVNSLFAALGVKVTFLIGLASTLLVDGFVEVLRHSYSGAGYAFAIIGLGINLIPIGIYVLLWRLSAKGNATAYGIGMGLYALDTLVMLLGLNIIAVAFHAYFLARIIMGFPFVNAYQRAQFAAMQPDPLPVPQAAPAPLPESGLGPAPETAGEPVGAGTATSEGM